MSEGRGYSQESLLVFREYDDEAYGKATTAPCSLITRHGCASNIARFDDICIMNIMPITDRRHRVGLA